MARSTESNLSLGSFVISLQLYRAKSSTPDYRPFRSSLHTTFMTLSETFPGGSGHLPDVGRFFNGGARTPRATNLLSRSECSLKFADTVRDVGDVSFAFNLLMLTFFIPNL